MVLQRKQYGTKETVCTYNWELNNFSSNEFNICIFPSEEGKNIQDYKRSYIHDLTSKATRFSTKHTRRKQYIEIKVKDYI